MANRKFTVKFETIPETLQKPFTDHFPAYDKGLIRTIPGGYVQHPIYAEKGAEDLFNLRVRSDDVWLRTFPRSGTTWTSEMLWLIVNNCDFEAAAKMPLAARSPNIDGKFMSDWEKMPIPKNLVEDNLITPEFIEAMPSPRVIKTHQMLATLNPDILTTCKNVYVVRNPKDVITSFFHFHKLFRVCEFNGDMELFAQYFMDDMLMFSPYFRHVLEGWSQRNLPNVLFLFYEDLKKDLRGQIQRVAKFLDKTLTEEQLVRLTEHLKIASFEKNESVNMEDVRRDGVAFNNSKTDVKFVRKGKTGDWKNHFGAELNSRIDAWIEKNTAGTGLSFVTELAQQD